MAQRLGYQSVNGPKGEMLKISWMPGNRVRIDFNNFSEVAVTKIFPSSKVTHIEFGYKKAATG